jgi:hypothetical protein
VYVIVAAANVGDNVPDEIVNADKFASLAALNVNVAVVVAAS